MPPSTRPRIIQRLYLPRLPLPDLQHRPARQPIINKTPKHRVRDLLRGRPLIRLAYELQFLGVLSPEGRLDNARRDAIDADIEPRFERGEAANKAVHGVLGRDVDGRVQVAVLARDGGYDEDAFGAPFLLRFLLRRGRGEEAADRELCGADRVRHVDVQRRVPASVASVFRSGTAGRVPEITPWWVVDACSGTDYVYRAERLGGHVEHSLQLCPVGDVCLLEHGSGVASVCFDEMLGFWT
jgi:hypothetical protein